MPDKTFSQKAVESVALRFILFVATSAGYAVLAWYTAHSAYLYAIPFYKVGPVIAVMALLGAATIYVLIVMLGRVQRQMAEVGGCEKTWLHDIEKNDRRSIDNVVRLMSIYKVGDVQHGAENPNVLFIMKIFQGSVYEITVSRQIEGFISYGDRRLRGELHLYLLPAGAPTNIRHSAEFQFGVVQELGGEDVDYILAHPGNNYFLANLIITITGGDDFPTVAPKPLSFEDFRTVSG